MNDMNDLELFKFPKFEDNKPLRLMTIKQVVEMLSITRPTLHKWTTKDNILKSIQIGGRVYYKGQDIDNLVKYR
jgi:predicted DNA-binding transcriptional regulator AlpA|tara:strand:+ start:489 stop:710 length:222 start_codon:yes stop_codon:yes gene_type:complete